MDSCLIQEDYQDFELKPDSRNCWITVDNVSIRIGRTDEGVVVDLYPVGREDEDAVASTWALNNE